MKASHKKAQEDEKEVMNQNPAQLSCAFCAFFVAHLTMAIKNRKCLTSVRCLDPGCAQLRAALPNCCPLGQPDRRCRRRRLQWTCLDCRSPSARLCQTRTSPSLP